MAKGNTDFKKRLNKALDIIIKDLDLERPRVKRLYTPVWRDRKYQWMSPMDSDGLLLKKRKINDGNEAPPKPVRLRIGVIIQSEFTTSQTKPNPFGKALVDRLPLGVWVDVEEKGRRRLDRTFILFVVPTATSAAQKTISAQARTYVLNAVDAAVEAHAMNVRIGMSAKKLAATILALVRPWLIGAGRPVGS